MREIEIKARVGDHRPIIDAIVRAGGVVSEPVRQHDRVYGVSGEDGDGDNSLPWLRIRTETKNDETTHFFTLKKSVTNQLDSIEHETIIEDDKELEKIIEYINFTPYSDLTKTRRKARFGDIEVCIDSVDGLGEFVEAEKLTADDVDQSAVIDELWTVLESLGVFRDDEVTDGYDVLMNKELKK